MKKQLVLFLALALCLGLTACGDTESDDTQSGYETVMDMEFLDGMWSIDGTAKLYFDSTEGFFAYRTRWGLGGRGEFELSEASGRPMIFFNGLLCCQTGTARAADAPSIETPSSATTRRRSSNGT